MDTDTLAELDARGTEDFYADDVVVMDQMQRKADAADFASTEVPRQRVAELEAVVAEAERQRQLVAGERDGALSELQQCRIALSEAKQAVAAAAADSDKDKAKLEAKVVKLEKSEKSLRQQLATATQSSAATDELAGQLVALQIEVRGAFCDIPDPGGV